MEQCTLKAGFRMENYTLTVEFIKYTGGAGIIALIWYLYHKSTTGYIDSILQQQKERDANNNENFREIIEQQAERENKNFKLLQDMIASNLLQNEKIQELKNKIENNMWCPIWRKFLRTGEFTSHEHNNHEHKEHNLTEDYSGEYNNFND